MKQTSRNGKYLVWQWCKSRRKDNPEIILFIQSTYRLKTLNREDMFKEEVRESRILSSCILPQKESNKVADYGTKDRTHQTD